MFECSTCDHCSMPIKDGYCLNDSCPNSKKRKALLERGNRSLSSIHTGTHRFRKIRDQARQRDKYLCQACLHGLYFNPYKKYNYENLEAHHIVKVEEDESLIYERTNLIMLCKYHHEKADHGHIAALDLQAIVWKNEEEFIYE
ncbi:hypothetical protein COE51_10845 [Bacillus pseudomycoides]|nr:hypothetical protein COE51_10845 [Bacillus pseudomycoides]